MKRRNFLTLSTAGTSALWLNPLQVIGNQSDRPKIRLGGPLFEKFTQPEDWVKNLKSAGYTAAYCPVGTGADPLLIENYRLEASRNNIIIAEVGAWSNPISPNEATAKAALQKCIDSLVLAEMIGAACCVNISGSRNEKHWAGPHADNLTSDTFDLIVETTRKIIDAVKPTRTFYTLEAMPWTYPDSTDAYLRLIKAIDRDRFAVHLDPVNFVCSPQILFSNGEMIRDAFKRLGPWIRSCHAKDVTIRQDTYLPQLDEVRPGLGSLDYKTFLRELSGLDNIPLMMEHLSNAEEYTLAAEHIRKTALSLNLSC
jgi:sugar phosphate isomerase/epimerase